MLFFLLDMFALIRATKSITNTKILLKFTQIVFFIGKIVTILCIETNVCLNYIVHMLFLYILILGMN
jgi:hypothetical protein